MKMAHAETIRKYFSAYEDGDQGAVAALLSDGFVFTGPYDYRIDRETYFKRCWPYSQTSPRYGLEKVFEEGDEAFVLYRCKTKDGSAARNTEFFVFDGEKIKEIEVYFGSAPKDTEKG
jgi:ketosteroid isomerase-like protein